MLPKTHIILGFILALILYLIFPKQIGILGALIILASSVLIDIDHYCYYIIKKKDFSLKNAYPLFYKNMKKFESLSSEERNKTYHPICLFHGFEILLVLFILAFFFNFLYLVLIGFFFHLFLDIFNICFRNMSPKCLFSQTYNIINSKNKILIWDYKEGKEEKEK